VSILEISVTEGPGGFRVVAVFTTPAALVGVALRYLARERPW
jgi:hypothetical protein